MLRRRLPLLSTVHQTVGHQPPFVAQTSVLVHALVRLLRLSMLASLLVRCLEQLVLEPAQHHWPLPALGRAHARCALLLFATEPVLGPPPAGLPVHLGYADVLVVAVSGSLLRRHPVPKLVAVVQWRSPCWVVLPL